MILILGLRVPTAQADLTLTPAGSAAGFSLSTFATGFPSSSGVGPLGIAFPGSGVLVTDYPGNVRFFTTDTDAQNAASFPPVSGATYGLSNAVGLAQVGSHIYMTQQGTGQVVEVNANGTLNQVILTGATGIGFATGIVANPANGHLFVSNVSQIFDVDPIAKTRTLFVSAGADGLTISSDGGILYGAVGGHILGFNTSSKLQVFDSGPSTISGLDGTALGFGSLAGNIFGNTNFGAVVEVNLATLAQTILATGGSRGDFVTVDPKDNTLLLTQTDRIVRLIAPTGGGFGGPTVPEPSTWILLGSGLAGLFALRFRRQT
jgi:DNA-binding beta-propeller fold protein YncE